MAKAHKKSCVPCASQTGHGIWQYNTRNLCWKRCLRGLALADGWEESDAENSRGFLWRLGHAAAAPTRSTHAPWGACPPHVSWGKMLQVIPGLSTGFSSGQSRQGGQLSTLRTLPRLVSSPGCWGSVWALLHLTVGTSLCSEHLWAQF